MISSWHNLDRIGVAFDENHAVANAGLLPATLAQMLGLRELVDRQVGRGDAPGRTNAGLKVMTVVAAMLAETAGVDVLRAGAIQTVLGHLVRAPRIVGHVRQLDAVSLARAPARSPSKWNGS
jgi:hypothetical protein